MNEPESDDNDILECKNCDKTLISCRYIIVEENPYCILCYQELFAHNCEVCKKAIDPDYKDFSYKDHHWHEFCFKCVECENVLVNQPFASKNDKIYCPVCYDTNFAARCDGCAKPFHGGMTKYEHRGKQWHQKCFVCIVCYEPITTKSFIPQLDHVVCIPCFDREFAQKCTKCKGAINKGGISYKNLSWHKECFTCTKCNTELAKERFSSQDDKPYCADCFGELFAKKCVRCTKPIAGSTLFEYEGHCWHKDCFTCIVCHEVIRNKSFVPKEEKIVCVPCYEREFAKKCCKCKGIIIRNGMLYLNQPWHKECFTCTHCNKDLMTEKFTTHDDNYYCPECYGEVFAEKCIRCTKPITGFGNSRFISFDGQHWHKNCFVCYKCNTSMVGMAFFVNEGAILCSLCGQHTFIH